MGLVRLPEDVRLESGVSAWWLCMSFLRSGDSEEDWTRLFAEIRWFRALGPGERVTLGERLLSHGGAVLACESRGEAARRFSGIRGERVRAVVLDPQGREVEGCASPDDLPRLGRYSTPPALTSFVVRSVHSLLRHQFQRDSGLADSEVRLLDPAAGDLNFVLEAFRVAIDTRRAADGATDIPRLVRDHLVPHFQGFEVHPAAFVRGYLAFQEFFAAGGFPLPSKARAPIALVDALSRSFPELDYLSPANVPVVVGNPPWRGRSANHGFWIRTLLRGYRFADGRGDEGYFRVDGKPLGERNPKWLQDDYVKFLRLAQWRVDSCREGIAAMVLNHTCLDAPTFRGLRRSLLRTFNEIYALNLHGNRRKREAAPGGGPDECLFPGVAQGAAVLFLLKHPQRPKRVFLADLFGTREAKLDTLAGVSIETIPWQELHPRPPLYFFVRGDGEVEREYRRGLPLPEIFPVCGAGIVTGRDALVTDIERRVIEARLLRLRERDHKISAPVLEGLATLREDAQWPTHLTGYLSRPFDVRHLFYAPYLMARPRQGLMAHMRRGENLGLVVPRQSKEGPAALATRWIVGHKAVSAYDVNTLFPLYLYGGAGRVPNLAPSFCHRLADLYGELPDPETVLGFIYAVLYSPPYRIRFRDLLMRDFPRIPFPQERERFLRLAELGVELTGLHVLKDSRLQNATVKVGGESRRAVGRPSYEESEQRLLLAGGELLFEGIEPRVWDYRIGGYAVLPHWLRARANRSLTCYEIGDFRRIAEALRLTLSLEERIADAYQGALES
ncbi:MAG: type ISP restriction/modification enzyme [Thermoanaerobaculia bacterium]